MASVSRTAVVSAMRSATWSGSSAMRGEASLPRSMRVGLNLVYLIAQSGGSGTYARELIPSMLELEPDTRIAAFVNAEAPPDISETPRAGEVEWVRLPVRVSERPPWHCALTVASQW